MNLTPRPNEIHSIAHFTYEEFSFPAWIEDLIVAWQQQNHSTIRILFNRLIITTGIQKRPTHQDNFDKANLWLETAYQNALADQDPIPALQAALLNYQETDTKQNYGKIK